MAEPREIAVPPDASCLRTLRVPYPNTDRAAPLFSGRPGDEFELCELASEPGSAYFQPFGFGTFSQTFFFAEASTASTT